MDFNVDIQQKKLATIEKAILVGVLRTFGKEISFSEPLAELENLADTAGVETVAKVTQQRSNPHPGSYIGKGKLEEIKTIAAELGATLIICNDHLSPSQAKRIEETTEVRVIDRTELILDIFAMHARSKEARLQIELAQMEYVLPRLKRMWTHLHSEQGGVGFRGPGEKQLEKDRQMVKKRIADCAKEIRKIQERKEREVGQRKKNFFTISLVGYTNAGKSSLMNALTEAGVWVEDKLFATIGTKTKMWEISQGRRALLSDTVGFIDRLPHHLVASFKATLEEASQADMLLHVVDISHPDAENHIEVVLRVLRQIGLEDCPMLLVFNKIDKIHDEVDLAHLRNKYPRHICISAKTGKNIGKFGERVVEMMETNMVEVDVDIPASDGKLLAWLAEYGRVVEQQYNGAKVRIHAWLTERNAHWLAKQPGVEFSKQAVLTS